MTYNRGVAPVDGGSVVTTGFKVPVFDPTTNSPYWITLAQFGSLIGAGSAVAPGQVGSLAAGTPTATTIPLTWTAPSTGTTPITYTVKTAPHGGSTYTSASGTFGATGGSITGLAASTNYDIQVIATNSAGSSTTSLTSGITTAASSSYPSMTFTTSPSFVTTGQKFGSEALSGGVGTASAVTGVTGGAGSNYCDLTHDFFITGTGAFTGTGALFDSIANNGVTAGWGFGSDGNLHGYVNGSSVGSITGSAVRNGAYHYLLIVPTSNAGGGSGNTDVYFFLDGTQQFNTTVSGTPILKTSTTTIGVDFTHLAAGDLIDDMRLMATYNGDASVPTAARTRVANTAILLPFDGSGTGI